MRNLIGSSGLIAGAVLAVALSAGAAAAHPLGVEIWNDRGEDALYQPGDPMQIKARINDDAYLLVYQIDAQGQISVLYPWHRTSALVDGRRTLRIPPEDSREELVADQETGEGFIVAIASRQPFRDLPWYLRPVDPQGESNGYEDEHADEEGFDSNGNVVGDPMVAMERIRRRVLGRPDDDEDFATSYTRYYIGHEVRYPRYLCADCHRPGQWAWWDGFDPYYSQCSVFDFRVNWNWAWGPSIWHGYVPYFYYTVRSDCPPQFRRWYDGRDRWSSWDGRRRWTALWGPDLTRRKSPPPVGYVPPPPRSDFRPNYPQTPRPGVTPPGYITGVYRRTSMPIGRNERAADAPGVSRGPARAPGEQPSPHVMPNREPVRREPPDVSPRSDTPPRAEPGRQPARREPPQATSPRNTQPRREPARRESSSGRSSRGGESRGGGGGRANGGGGGGHERGGRGH